MKGKTTPTRILFTLFVLLSALTVKAYAQEVGQVAPNFTLTNIDGNEFSLSDYRGKIVILDFFAIY